MNILEHIVQGYMFQETEDIVGNPSSTKMKGGYPLSKLVDNIDFITQSGGKATTASPSLKQLENLAIPTGLVYMPHRSDTKLEYGEGSLLDDGVVPNDLYDKLVGLVSHSSSSHSGNKTKKNIANSGGEQSKTKKVIK